MIHPFGGPVSLIEENVGGGPSARSAQDDMDLVREALAGLNDGGPGFLRIYRPRPTAAFSPRDTTLGGYQIASDQLRARGFEPVERRAGGQLAVYDEGALVIDIVAPHADPRAQFLKRFQLLSGAIASTLVAFSIDARIGALPGEYCPGDYSVNGTGRIKLAGLAQRIVRSGYHLGAVISVVSSSAAKDAVAEAYRNLGIDFDPSTFGAISDVAPGPSFPKIQAALLDAITSKLT